MSEPTASLTTERMPQGARDTQCPECEFTYGTHEHWCSHYEPDEPGDPDGECYRGGEYEASVQRELAEARLLK